MKKQILAFGLVACSCLFTAHADLTNGVVASAFSVACGQAYVEGELLVKYRGGQREMAQSARTKTSSTR